MIISPTSGWKKISCSCFIVSGGITRLVAKTHNNSTSCYGTRSIILRFGICTGFETYSL
jgi:hypothetical protein